MEDIALAALNLLDEILEVAKNEEWHPGALDGDDYTLSWEAERDRLVKLYQAQNQ